MSRLDQLISQYCPAGVPMVRLGELMTRSRKKSAGEKASVYTVSNSLGLIPSDSLHDFSVYSADTSNYLIVKKGMFAYNPARLNIGSIACMQDEIGLVSPMYVVFSIDSSRILERYMYYTVKSSEVNFAVNGMTEEGARFRFDFDKWNKITIPLPPLPVQEEIVRILDAMSDLVTNLDAEISARQKQYEHAREKLLTFGEEVEKVPLNDVASHYTGLTYKPDDVSESGTLVLRSSNIQNSHIVLDDNVYVNMANIPCRALVKENDILVCVRNGSKALIGKSAIIMKDIVGAAFGAFMTVLRAERIHYKFLFYVWQSRIVQEQIMGDGGAPINQITNKEFAIISIPLPSLSVQQSIVERLDKMESLIQNLQAERDLRQKQYEYYREKLLTFERT